MVTRTGTDHLLGVVDFAACAWLAFVAGLVVVLVVGTDCAVLPVEVWVVARTVFALFVEYVVDLLLGTVLACLVSEIPVFGVHAQHARFLVPEIVFGLVADTFS